MAVAGVSKCGAAMWGWLTIGICTCCTGIVGEERIRIYCQIRWWIGNDDSSAIVCGT